MLPDKLMWTDMVLAPDDIAEEVDEFGNGVVGKWISRDLTEQLWQGIRGATIEGCLGIGAKVSPDRTRACVYTRDYRDIDDLRRVLGVLRAIGVTGWITYKRDCETAHGVYGTGASYWTSPPGTTEIRTPRLSVGRYLDRVARKTAHDPGERPG